MDFDINKIVQNELLLNENIIWQGTPSLSKTFTKSDIFLVPFSIFWGGFAIFWFIAATTAGGMFGLFGIPFVIVGLYFIFGRFIVKKAVKRKTIYAITDIRVLIIRINSSGIKKSVSSAAIRTISSESNSCDKNGIGTIIFGSPPYWHTIYLNTGMDFFSGNLQNGIIAFFDIEDCEKVIKIYRDLKYQ